MRSKPPKKSVQPNAMTPSRARRLAIRLLAWYDGAGRRFPWRANSGRRPDPYRVWLAEIMLQQTTTASMTPYFEAFPVLNSCARAKNPAFDGGARENGAGLATAEGGRFTDPPETARRAGMSDELDLWVTNFQSKTR